MGWQTVSIYPENGQPVRLSVVVPVFNEAENVLPLLEEIERALTPVGGFEIIFVDDQSDDDTQARLAALPPEVDIVCSHDPVELRARTGPPVST